MSRSNIDADTVETLAEKSTDLSAAVLRGLHSASWATLKRIQVEADWEQVTLRGTVQSFYLKQLAQHAAASAAGSPQIHNLIVVEGAEQCAHA